MGELRCGRGRDGAVRRLAGARRSGCAVALARRRRHSASTSAVCSRGASKGAARDAVVWSMARLGFGDVGMDAGLGQGGATVI